MRLFLAVLTTAVFTLTAAAQPPAVPQFKRGLHRTPAHKYAAAPKFQAPGVVPPPQFSMIPAALGMYGNDQYGDCVSAQEAVSLCAWTTYCGAPVKPTDAEVIAFARKYGLLNGANLDQVMDIMASKGMVVGGKVYKDGPYATVDYSNVSLLQTALTVGPVNVAIDANALPAGAGSKQGWYGFGGSPGEYPNTDHCITFLAYGPAAFCFKVIGVDLPAGVDPNKPAYVADTWKTLGVVDQSWVMSTMAEAWVRNPTTIGFTPPVPVPVPTPTPTPTPPGPTPPPVPPQPIGPGYTGSVYYQNGVLVGFGPLPGPPAAEDIGAAFKFCPEVFFAAMKLYMDVQAKAPPDAIAADVAALNAAYQNCKKQQPMTAAPGGFPSPTPLAGAMARPDLPDPMAPNGFWIRPGATAPGVGDCQQFGTVGACGISAGACSTAATGFSLRHPLGGRFAVHAPAAQSCGQESAYMAGSCGQAAIAAPQLTRSAGIGVNWHRPLLFPNRPRLFGRAMAGGCQ